MLVIKPFIDKQTLRGYSEGDNYESDDSERVTFLVEKGYLKGPKPAPKATSKAKGRKSKAGE
jgi:hypothetical protein